MDEAQAPYQLLLDARRGAAQFVLECPACGAMTFLPLEMAWHARAGTCSECKLRVPIDSNVLDSLRAQAASVEQRLTALGAK